MKTALYSVHATKNLFQRSCHTMLLMMTTVLAAVGAHGAPRHCATCRPPVHSWDTMPVSFHSAATDTGPRGLWSESDLQIIKKFPLVTIEKWQGSSASDPATNDSVFLWEEDAWLAAAKQIKSVSPNTSVIVWMDTLLVYTGWNMDPHNKTVNTTLNPDANAECATGHFRPAEYLETEGRSLLLKNSSNKLALSSFGHCHVYDHSQAAARQQWTNQCLDMTDSGVVDGCGADFSAMGWNEWSMCTPENIAADMGLDLKTATAWTAGHRRMMNDTQTALGQGLLIAKDPAELGDHANGVLQETGCYKRNSTVNNLQNLTARRRAAGELGSKWVYQCHGRDTSNDTLAAFLVGAGDGDFFTVGGWYNGAQGHWADEFDRPLGPPLADAIYNHSTETWSRVFASGTKATFTPHVVNGRDMGGTGTVEWGTNPF